MINIANAQNASQGLIFNTEGLNETYDTAYYAGGALVAKYTMFIRFLKAVKKQSVIEISRGDEIEGNSAGIQNHAFDLAAACGKILYPVELILDEQANITGINNHKEIINRWLKQAPALVSYYTDDAVESYLAQTEQTIMNADAVAASMRRDFFISACCMPLNMNIRDGNAAKMQRRFYLPEQVTAEVQQSASAMKGDNEHFQVQLSAASLPGEPVSFEAEALYVLQRPSCRIESLDFLWKIKQGDEPYEINIKIELKK